MSLVKEITSNHNETYKHLKLLATSAKQRRRHGQTLLEGVHLCESYLQHIGRPLMHVFTQSAADSPEVARLIEESESLSSVGVLLGEAKFKLLSSVENGIGIMFVVKTPSSRPPAVLQESALLMENIQDPGNMGAILRTAAAAGIKHVFVSRGSVSAWSPKVLRAGMGAHFAMSIYENCDLSSLIKSAQVPVLATSLGASESIYQKDLSGPSAWLVGNEGQGVSDELMTLGVEAVIIPQNPDVESLNVAAATAICLFEQVRQRSLRGEHN